MRSETADKILEKAKNKKTPYNIELLDIKITILKDVYPPGEESILLAEQLTNSNYGIKKQDFVLDYGCGTGFLGIIAAKLGAKVIAIDINLNAIKNTKINVKNNSVNDSMEIRYGKSFKTVKSKERFDVILASLPYENAKINNILEYAVYDPYLQMRKALFSNTKKHLTEKGRIFFSYSKRAQKITPIQKSGNEFNYRIIVKKIIENEPYIIFLITRKK